MKRLARVLAFLAVTAGLQSCVLYKHYDREVRVWNPKTSQVSSGDEFRFSHAVPAPHFPRNPDPVRVQLDPDGVAMVRLPAVLGWAGTSRHGTALIDGPLIRDGGTAELKRHVSNDAPVSTGWKITISKPGKNSVQNEQMQATGAPPAAYLYRYH